MDIQQEIALDINRMKIGSILKVVIDREEEDYFVGRTEFDSPEVDGEVLISGKKLSIGQYYQVKITDSEAFDLYGEIV
jgi:ribosomal protein S12 methylthiotransferase